MTQAERDLGRRWFEQVWTHGRREAIAEMLAPEAVLHEAESEIIGPAGFYPYFDRMSASFSGVQIDVLDTIAEDGKICVRWLFTATHIGEGLGVAPTGVKVHVTGITVLRVADGQIVEGWQNWDMLGMMEQIKGLDRAATFVTA